MLCDHDHDERQPVCQQQQAGHEPHHEADEGTTPEPAKALADLGTQRSCRGASLALERCLDGTHRRGGHPKRQRIRQERQHAARAIHRPAQQRAEQEGQIECYIIARDRDGQLLLGDDAWEACCVGQIEEDEQDAFNQRDRIDLHQREPVERHRDRQTGQRQRAPSIADDHDALAIPPVDQRAHREAEEHIGQRAQRAYEARLGGRVGERQHQQWIGEQRDLGSRHGDCLSAPQ